MQDPFKNFKPLNSPKRNDNKTAKRGDGFVESLQGIGSSAVSSFKNDVVKGTAQSIFDSLLGAARSGQAPDQSPDNFDFYKDWMEEREKSAAESARSQERAFQEHRRADEKVLFSLSDEKIKQEIDSVRQELAMLVKTMGQVQAQIENAVIEEVTDPGVYHLNFFNKLKTWLVFMRKSLEDASTWMQLSSGRGKRSYYWQQANKSGTKYTLSSERYMQMSAG